MIKDILKDFLLKKQCRAARNAGNVFPRNTVNYHQINQIGVLFHIHPDVDPEPLTQFLKKLEQDHKKIKILTYFDYPYSHRFPFYFDYFLKADIKWNGDIQSAKMDHFLDTSFDFLFCIESEPQPVFDLILSKTKANCRVGLYNEKRTGLFELMVNNPDPKNIGETLKQILNYTKLLIYND